MGMNEPYSFKGLRLTRRTHHGCGRYRNAPLSASLRACEREQDTHPTPWLAAQGSEIRGLECEFFDWQCEGIDGAAQQDDEHDAVQ